MHLTEIIQSPNRTLILHERPGYGSAIVEAQLAIYGVEFERRRVGEFLKDDCALQALISMNPVGQLPVVELGNGAVLTESAAITLWLAETYGRGDHTLVPRAGSATRPEFLRWLIYWVSSPYAVFAYLDRSSEMVADASARGEFEKTLRRRLEILIGLLEASAKAPWFLGESFSALDIYAAVFSEWTPGRDWYREHAPRLSGIAENTWKLDTLAPIYARNFVSEAPAAPGNG